MRLLRALFNYMSEPGDRNLLGFRVGPPCETHGLLWHYRELEPIAVEYEEPEPTPNIITQPDPPKPRKPTRMEVFSMIEAEHEEDLAMAALIQDPMSQQFATRRAEQKKLARVAKLIG